jgi:hypothetical protein
MENSFPIYPRASNLVDDDKGIRENSGLLNQKRAELTKQKKAN